MRRPFSRRSPRVSASHSFSVWSPRGCGCLRSSDTCSRVSPSVPSRPVSSGDAGVASQLAEVGVILLMFGVGLHFSRAISPRSNAWPSPARPFRSWSPPPSGRAWRGSGAGPGRRAWCSGSACRSRARWCFSGPSRAGERSIRGPGRIAVGWLIVEDIFTVLILVLLPLIASLAAGRAVSTRFLVEAAFTLAKVAAFVGVMHVAGRRAVPWILGRVARTGSRELFTLGILAHRARSGRGRRRAVSASPWPSARSLPVS